MKEAMLKNIPYMMSFEVNRLENCTGECASLVWDESTDQFIIVYWEECWDDTYTINKIDYTESDSEDEIMEKLWRLGYHE